MNTGHPTEERLTSMKWAGKTFRSTEDVDPIEVYQENGERVWNLDWGHARVSWHLVSDTFGIAYLLLFMDYVELG